MCTRSDKALQEDVDEPTPTFSSDELPENSSDDDDIVPADDDDSNPSNLDTVALDHNAHKCGDDQELAFKTLQYSTRIHERVFDDLVTEGFMKDLKPYELESHDLCPLFHCVSAYAAQTFSRAGVESERNPFVQDFLQFEKCLADVIVESLNFHVQDALEELIRKQMLLIESMFQKKFSLGRKAVAAERKLQFVVKTEDRIYVQLKDAVAKGNFRHLQKIIEEERATCLTFLPQLAGKLTVVIDGDPSHRNESDLKVAHQVREYVCDKFNERFKERVQDEVPVLNVGETIETCVKSMQDQASKDLEAARLVSTIVQAAYRPLSYVAGVKKGLPLKLHFERFMNALMRRELSESYTREWKETVARDLLESLKAKALARDYCAGVEETLEKAHAEFKSGMKDLEAVKQAIVETARDQQHEMRIKDGYELAAVFLQSRSFLDPFVHGAAEKGKKIGEGPTSVVYECQRGKWGSNANLILKSRKPWPPPVSREVWPASLYFSM